MERKVPLLVVHFLVFNETGFCFISRHTYIPITLYLNYNLIEFRNSKQVEYNLRYRKETKNSFQVIFLDLFMLQ